MADDYPEPDCRFGIAIKKDIEQILETQEEILEQQGNFSETLQNGLSTKVQQNHEKLKKIKKEQKNKAEQKQLEERQEEKRANEWNKMIASVFLTNLLAIGGGIFIAWLF